MKRFKVFVLSLCIGLSVAELLGPDMKKEVEKAEEDDTNEILDTSAKVDPEYISELTDALNKEIITLQEYADALRKQGQKVEEEPSKGKIHVS